MTVESIGLLASLTVVSCCCDSVGSFTTILFAVHFDYIALSYSRTQTDELTLPSCQVTVQFVHHRLF